MTRSEAIEKVLAVAKSQLGVQEHPRGSNRGTQVEAYLASTGLDGGYPWCAGFVTWCGVEALGKLWPMVRSADCDALLAWARNHGVLHDSPQRGDVGLRLASQDDANHTFFDLDNDATIEGNTNDGGSRDGYGVFARHRQGSQYKYVRWVDVMDFSNPWKVVLPSGPWPAQKVRSGENERPCVPVRAFVATLLGVASEFSPVMWAYGKIEVKGKPINSFTVDNTVWAAVRDIATALGAPVTVVDRTVIIGTPVTDAPATATG